MNLLDLRSLAVQHRIIHDTSITLAGLAEYQLGVHLNKPTSIRLYSSWGGTLSREQIEYAALDVLVGLRLYESIQQRIPPQLTHYDPSHVQLGSDVYVYSNNMDALIAYGTIVTTSSSSTGSNWSGATNTFLHYTNVIKDTMVVVRVIPKDVIVPSALVHTQLLPQHNGTDVPKPKAERPSLGELLERSGGQPIHLLVHKRLLRKEVVTTTTATTTTTTNNNTSRGASSASSSSSSSSSSSRPSLAQPQQPASSSSSSLSSSSSSSSNHGKPSSSWWNYLGSFATGKSPFRAPSSSSSSSNNSSSSGFNGSSSGNGNGNGSGSSSRSSDNRDVNNFIDLTSIAFTPVKAGRPSVTIDIRYCHASCCVTSHPVTHHLITICNIP